MGSQARSSLHVQPLPGLPFVAVLLAGGSGERFWPLSRRAHPKQFLNLEGHHSLIQSTWRRLDALCAPDHRFVVSSLHQRELIGEHLPELSARNLILEPMPRDTAAAVLLAALHLRARFGEDVAMGVFPSDHRVQDIPGFERAVRAAIREALTSDAIITFGIRPTHPATGYGYIELHTEHHHQAEFAVHRTKRFTEKPDQNTAEAMLRHGNYLWNAGIFVFRVGAILELFRTLQPELLGALESSFDSPHLEQTFAALPKISLDYAILERAPDVRALPVSFGWDDLGDWTALERLADGDNVSLGKHLALETSGSIVVNQSSDLVVTLGMEDVVVVRCDDVTLVMPKHRAQDIKRVLTELRASSDGSRLT
jgi:mannose-1-phosphate guanylyltransferase